MHLLIIGGTVFLGRALVDAARARGHRVTLFNRGRHNADLYPEVEKLRGDRDGDLDALRGRRFDAVIDTCGYFPRVVRQSAELLADATDHYTFISSVSAYPNMTTPGQTEDSPVGDHLDDPATEQITGATYGPLKVACERAVEAALPNRTLVIRPGLIVGPHDPSDRFTYWPHRIDRGGPFLAPVSPALPSSEIIDVRDLAEWNIRLIEDDATGIFNAAGPDDELTIGAVIDACRAASGGDSEPVWVSGKFLVENQVGPWIELPLWVPDETDPEKAGLARFRSEKSATSGLTFRPLAETVADTLAWDRTRPAADANAYKNTLQPDREAELLSLWRRSASA